jgi:microcystin-dependent protein
MAGTFPGICNTQQNDTDGAPLDGAIVTVYQGGTTVLASVFQDIGLSIPGQNPMVADLSGRVPLFFVADGVYRVRLSDKFGTTSNGGFDYPQVPSIGASSSGGGGTAVDPTTVLSTGDVKWRPVDDVLTGFVRINGRTLGNATSGASERANADTQSLFTFLWNTFPDAICPVLGGRGASAVSDFGASKQITLLDMRFRSPFGLDTMGAAAAGRAAGVTFATGNSTTQASQGGEGAHTLAVSEMPAHNHPGSTAVNAGQSATQFVTNVASGPTSDVQGGSCVGLGTITKANVQGSDFTSTLSIATQGGGGTHNTMPPFMLGTWYQKL